MTVINGQPATPMTTTVPARVNSTQAAEIASFAQYDNSEYEVIDIGRTYAPILYTITRFGRVRGEGDMKDMGLNEMTVRNFPEHKWDEKDEYNDQYKVNGEVANPATTTLTLDSTAGLYPHLILRIIDTNEKVRITAVASATALTIQRGVGETAAALIPDDADIVVLGTASENGEMVTDSFFTENQHKGNYFHKIVTTVTQKDFDRLGFKVGNYEERMMAEKLRQHAKEKEMVTLFSEKSAKTNPVTGEKYYTAGGLIDHCLDGWTDDISSALTLDTFEESLEKSFQYGSQDKIVMCSSKVKRAIRALYLDNFTINDSLKDLDLNLESIKMDRGTITFVIHPYLNSESGYEDTLFILDPEFIKVVYPTADNEGGVNFGVDGKTKFLMDMTQTNAVKATGSFMTYFTLQRMNANAFGAIKVI